MRPFVAVVVSVSFALGCSTVQKEVPERITENSKWRAPAALEGDAEITAASRRILENRRLIEERLAAKAHILTKDYTFKAQGNLEGQISGSFKGNSGGLNLKGAMIGALLGGLTGFGAGAAATTLGSAIGLEQFMLGAGILGAGAGALMPSGAQGQLNGSLKGEYAAEGWENHYEAKHFIMTVVDPQLLQFFENISPADRSKGLEIFIQAQRALFDSGRFFTVNEAYDTMKSLEQMRTDINELQMAAVDLNMAPENSKKIMDFTEMISKWMNKKVSIISFARHDIEVRTEIGQMFSVPVTISGQGLPRQQAVFRAFIPHRNSLSKQDYQSILSQWRQQYHNIIQGREAPSSAALRIGGKEYALNDLLASDKGVVYSRFFKKKPVPPLEKSVLNVHSLSSAGVPCRSSKDANEFLSRTSKMSESFFSYVDSRQVQAMLNGSATKSLPTQRLTDDGFMK